jgi:hypothetical protein
MSVLHTYTVLTVGDCTLHQLHLAQGKVKHTATSQPSWSFFTMDYSHVSISLQHFVMGEGASNLFGATPTSFLQVPCCSRLTSAETIHYKH